MPRAMLLLLLLVSSTFVQAATAPPNVVASIRPLHGIAAALMEGVGEPRLLLDGAASPHGHALRPSEARALQDADLVLLVGAGLDRFVERHLAASDAPMAVAMSDVPGVRTLPLRMPGMIGHGDDGHRHGGSVIDPHLWLDPENAAAMADAVAEALIDIDPARAEVYSANRVRYLRELKEIDARAGSRLADRRDGTLISFHDGLQYFTARYGIDDAGSIAGDAERAPGARTVRSLRDRLAGGGPLCIAIEPGPEPPVLGTVLEGLPASVHRFDPLGRDLPAGAGHYGRLIVALAESTLACLEAADD